MKLAFSGDTLANRWWTEAAKGADLAIHECFLPNENFVSKYKFQPAEAIYVSTLVHTTAPVFGKIMAFTEPKHEVPADSQEFSRWPRLHLSRRL